MKNLKTKKCTIEILGTDKTKRFSQNRSAASDLTTDILKIMKNVVNDANAHLSNLIEDDTEVATINPRDQPDFMHNLLFR